MKKSYKKKKFNPITIGAISFLVCTLIITVGFASYQASLDIRDVSATVRVQKDIRVTGVTVSSPVSDASSNWEDYNVKSISSSVNLPNEDSTLIYDVEITNIGNVEMGIADITGLSDNLTYSISNYNLKDKLCDDANPNECKLGTTSTLHITIGYKEGRFDASNTTYPLNLNFDFKRIFPITYKNVNNNNYPTQIMEGDTKTITFVDDIPKDINVIGVTTFKFESPILTISDPTDDVIISAVISSVHYDEIVFDGTNYINTGIQLFSEENIGKNFEISFELTNVGSNQVAQATLFNAMQEKNPYPGFVMRAMTNTSNLEFNSPKIKNRTGININTTQKIILKRYNDVYYIKINDNDMERLGSYSGGTFDVPLTIGASLDGSGNPWRYFKGTMSNVNVELTDPEYYTVKFDSNGGTGTMSDQMIRKDDKVNLTANVFEREGQMFDEWNTEPAGSGVDYSDGQSVRNLTKTENDVVNLYAIWAEEYYKHPGEYVFNGSNYIDTDVYPYSSANVNKNYEISFEIVSSPSNSKQATLMNAMYEVEPWPGVLVRVSSDGTQFEVDMNGGSGKFNKRYLISSTNKVVIKRENGIIYVSINDEGFIETRDHSSITTFDIPVTFGASLLADKTPQRYYKGTLKNMQAIIFE